MSLLRVSRWMKLLATLPETLFLFLQDTAGAKLLIYNCAANLSPRTYVLVLSRKRTAVKTLHSANRPQRYMGAQAQCTEQKIKIVLIALLEMSVSSIINETVWNIAQPSPFVI